MGAEPALDTVVWFPVRSNSKFFLSLLPIDGGKLQQEDPTAAIEKRREVVIRGLIEYMGEKPGDLISDLQSLEETEDTRQNIAYPVKIVKVGDTYEISIDGLQCITGLGTVAKASCILVGVIYALDLKYPPKLQHTFETFQRLLIGLSPVKPRASVRYSSLLKKLS